MFLKDIILSPLFRMTYRVARVVLQDHVGGFCHNSGNLDYGGSSEGDDLTEVVLGLDIE